MRIETLEAYNIDDVLESFTHPRPGGCLACLAESLGHLTTPAIEKRSVGREALGLK